MLVVAGEDQVGETLARHLHVDLDVGMDHRHDEIRPGFLAAPPAWRAPVSISSAKVMSPGEEISGVSVVVRP